MTMRTKMMSGRKKLHVISKELLSAVVGYEVDNVYENVPPFIQYFATYCRAINKYELACLCKEWALANGFAISSGIPKPFYKKRIIGAEIFKLTDFRNAIFICYQESEYDAIIEACEWLKCMHELSL